MLFTNHALTGMALATVLQNPLLVAPVAFVSHLLLDMVPHFGWKTASFTDRRWLALATGDVLVGSAILVTAVWIQPQLAAALVTGVLFATLPDLLFLPEIFLKRTIWPAFRRFHGRIQWSETPPGLLVELAWAAMMAAFLATQ